jgi:hypothetical protein
MQSATDTIVFHCPKCAKTHRAQQSAVGKPVTCSGCRTTFTIPTSNTRKPANPDPVSYWQPVAPAQPQTTWQPVAPPLPPAEPVPDPEDWTNAGENQPLITTRRRPRKRRSFAFWKVAIIIGHLTLLAAAVAVLLILYGR